MATIKPFRGIMYNQKIVGDLSAAIAPPYDVIGPREQEELYRRSPYNLIRLEYGRILPGDDERHNRYTRARAAFEEWLKKGVLLRDAHPSLYLYEQVFSFRGRQLARTALAAALRVEEYAQKSVLPHEETMRKPKEDRRQLLRTCRAGFSPIFALYEDPGQVLDDLLRSHMDSPPLLDFAGAGGLERHHLWRIDDKELLRQITDFFAPLSVLIADGHHRYETALRFSREDGAPGSGYTLAFLVSLHSPGLVVLPTHRLLQLPSAREENSLLELLTRHFQIRELGDPASLSPEKLCEELAQEGRRGTALGLVLPSRACLLVTAGEVGELDTVVLQEYIIKPLLAQWNLEAPEQVLRYTREEQEAWQWATAEGGRAAFLLNPVSMEQVVEKARRGEKMPQKTTYFYPKMPGGLVIYSLDDFTA